MKIASNYDNFIATQDNKVWTWVNRRWDSGKLLAPPSIPSTPSLLNIFDGVGVKSVKCSWKYATILTNNGSLYVIGFYGNYFQIIKNVDIVELMDAYIVCATGNSIYVYYCIEKENICEMNGKHIFDGIIKKMTLFNEKVIALTDRGLYYWSDITLNIKHVKEIKFDNYDQITEINCSRNIIILSVMENSCTEFHIGDALTFNFTKVYFSGDNPKIFARHNSLYLYNLSYKGECTLIQKISDGNLACVEETITIDEKVYDVLIDINAVRFICADSVYVKIDGNDIFIDDILTELIRTNKGSKVKNARSGLVY